MYRSRVLGREVLKSSLCISEQGRVATRDPLLVEEALDVTGHEFALADLEGGVEDPAQDVGPVVCLTAGGTYWARLALRRIRFAMSFATRLGVSTRYLAMYASRSSTVPNCRVAWLAPKARPSRVNWTSATK